jgi:G3E family GTPase
LTVVDAFHIQRHLDIYFKRKSNQGENGGLIGNAHKQSQTQSNTLRDNNNNNIIMESKLKDSSIQSKNKDNGFFASLFSSSTNNKASEPIQQIAFADRILINKIDLINENNSGGSSSSNNNNNNNNNNNSRLDRLLNDISAINPHANMLCTSKSEVEMNDIFDIRAFDPSKNDDLLKKWNFDMNQKQNQNQNQEVHTNNNELLIQRDKVTGKIMKNKLNFSRRNTTITSVDPNCISTVSIETDIGTYLTVL